MRTDQDSAVRTINTDPGDTQDRMMLEVWDRRERGESLNAIAHYLGRYHSPGDTLADLFRFKAVARNAVHLESSRASKE